MAVESTVADSSSESVASNVCVKEEEERCSSSVTRTEVSVPQIDVIIGGSAHFQPEFRPVVHPDLLPLLLPASGMAPVVTSTTSSPQRRLMAPPPPPPPPQLVQLPAARVRRSTALQQRLGEEPTSSIPEIG